MMIILTQRVSISLSCFLQGEEHASVVVCFSFPFTFSYILHYVLLEQDLSTSSLAPLLICEGCIHQ